MNEFWPVHAISLSQVTAVPTLSGNVSSAVRMSGAALSASHNVIWRGNDAELAGATASTYSRRPSDASAYAVKLVAESDCVARLSHHSQIRLPPAAGKRPMQRC